MPIAVLAVPIAVLAVAVVTLIGSLVFAGQNKQPVSSLAADAQPAPASSSPAASPSAEPSAAPENSAAHEQAVAINDLLDQSKPSRGALRRAIAQILRCTQVGKGISAIQRVTDQRGKQVTLAEKLAVDALDSGEELKQSLVDALSESHRADKARLKWAKRFKASGCTGPTVGDSAYDAGNAASEDATAAKADFVAQWSPIAQQEGLSVRTEEEI